MNHNKLAHPRLPIVRDVLSNILDGCVTISAFISRVENRCEIIQENDKVYFYDKYGISGANCLKGDIWEICAEHFFHCYGSTVGGK